ncbi:hypothetical protein Tco_1459902 [Tanacetum coccineum]
MGICFPGDLSPGIGRAEKLEGDTFPGDLPGRHRGAHTVSVKQIFATVEGGGSESGGRGDDEQGDDEEDGEDGEDEDDS